MISLLRGRLGGLTQNGGKPCVTTAGFPCEESDAAYYGESFTTYFLQSSLNLPSGTEAVSSHIIGQDWSAPTITLGSGSTIDFMTGVATLGAANKGGILNRMFGRILGWFRTHEPNPAVAAGTDVAGLVTPFAGKAGKVLGPVGSIVSVANDSNPTNVTLNVVPFIVEDTAFPLAFVGAEADLLNFEAQQVGEGMINAIPGSTMDDGYGHTVPNPQTMEDCQIFGACQ